MTDLRETAQQFVSDYENGDLGDLKHYARALRAALAQQEQEPVAWSPSLTYPNYEKERVWLNGKPRQEDVEYWSKNGNGITYVYTAPPRREWKGLSDTEVLSIHQSLCNTVGSDYRTVARAIEAKLKEKNEL
jgi:hypothetical protein